MSQSQRRPVIVVSDIIVLRYKIVFQLIELCITL